MIQTTAAEKQVITTKNYIQCYPADKNMTFVQEIVVCDQCETNSQQLVLRKLHHFAKLCNLFTFVTEATVFF